MAMMCTICSSPLRDVLEMAILGGASNRAIARQHGVSRDAVARHMKAGHVPVAVLATSERKEAERVVSLTERAEYLWHRAEAILESAEGRPAIELQAVRELRAVVELLGKLTGAFSVFEDHPVQISLTLHDGRPLRFPSDQPALPEGD